MEFLKYIHSYSCVDRLHNKIYYKRSLILYWEHIESCKSGVPVVVQW